MFFFGKKAKTPLAKLKKTIEEQEAFALAEYLLEEIKENEAYWEEHRQEVLKLLDDCGYLSMYVSEGLSKGKRFYLALPLLAYLQLEEAIQALFYALNEREDAISLPAVEALKKMNLDKYQEELLLNFYKSPARTGTVISGMKEKGKKLLLEGLDQATKEEKILLLRLLGEFFQEEGLDPKAEASLQGANLHTLWPYLEGKDRDLIQTALEVAGETLWDLKLLEVEIQKNLMHCILPLLKHEAWQIKVATITVLDKLGYDFHEEKIVLLKDEHWLVKEKTKALLEERRRQDIV
jgi:hypothetical protein